MAPNDESAMLMQRMQDSNLCPLWRLTLINVRKVAQTHRDVKNEGTSGDVYENKGAHDTMPDNKSRFWPKNAKVRDNRGETRVFLKGNARIVGREAEKCSFLRFTQDRLRLLRMTGSVARPRLGDTRLAHVPSVIGERFRGGGPASRCKVERC
jgi:hypothetical protein